MTVLEQLQVILRDFTGDGSLTLAQDTRLTADMGLDSYDLVSLIGLTEDHFEVEIPDRAVLQMITAGDVAAYIQQLIANKGED